MSKTAAVIACLLACSLPASASRADVGVQVSSRLVTGAGASLGAGGAFVLDAGIRADALFGAFAPDVVRIGPAIDIRTRDYKTGEFALGLALSLPVLSAFPLLVTVGGGYAARPGPGTAPDNTALPAGRSSPFMLTELAIGYRPFNYHSSYGFAVGVYVAARFDPTEPGYMEISGGLQIDLEFILGIPVLYGIMAARGSSVH